MKYVIYKEKYFVYEDSTVYNSKTKRFLNFNIGKRGYSYISINNNNELHHRIIAKCFIPNFQNKPCINHINGIKHDNRIENLEWCTQSENILHSFHIGTSKISENNKIATKKKNGRLVLNIQTGIYYDCISDAAKSANIKTTTLQMKLMGVNKNNTLFIFA